MLNRGSEWRRWEPHIHAPGTVMNNQFSGPTAWHDYFSALEQATPVIEAIAVTDCYVTDTYEEVLRQKQAGRRCQVNLERSQCAAIEDFRRLLPPRISNPPSPRGDADGCGRRSGVIEVERRGCGRRRKLERNTEVRPMIGSPASFAPVFGSGRGNSQHGCSDPYEIDVRPRA